MLRKKWFWFVASFVLIGGMAVLWVLMNAPELSSIEVQTCIENTTGQCLILPQVSGGNLAGETLAFPEVFTHKYNIVIMPFDRDQQSHAVEWLEPLQEITQDSSDTGYYSIAALPDLPAGIRLLVVGGMNVAITQPETRAISVILFLQDQTTFLQALDISSIETPQLFLFDQQGKVLWRASGEYSEETLRNLQNQLKVNSTEN